MEIDRLEIAKLELKDGDVLAVIHREPMTYAILKELHDDLVDVLKPMRIKLIVLSGDYEIKIINRDEDPDITLCH